MKPKTWFVLTLIVAAAIVSAPGTAHANPPKPVASEFSAEQTRNWLGCVTQLHQSVDTLSISGNPTCDSDSGRTSLQPIQTPTREDQDQVQQWIQEITTSSHPTATAYERLVEFEIQAGLSDAAILDFYERAKATPALSQPITRASEAFNRAKTLWPTGSNTNWNIPEAIQRIRLRLQSKSQRLPKLRDQQIGGELGAPIQTGLFAPSFVMNARDREAATELSKEIQEKLKSIPLRSSDPEEFIRIYDRYADFMSEYQKIEFGSLDQIDQTVAFYDKAITVTSVVGNASRATAVLAATATGGPAAGAAMEMAFCMAERYSSRSSQTQNQTEEDSSQFHSDALTACSISAGITAAAGAGALRSIGAIEKTTLTQSGKIAAVFGTETAIGLASSVATEIATQVALAQQQRSLCDAFLSAVHEQVDQYSSSEGLTTLALQTLLARRVTQLQLASAPQQFNSSTPSSLQNQANNPETGPPTSSAIASQPSEVSLQKTPDPLPPAPPAVALKSPEAITSVESRKAELKQKSKARKAKTEENQARAQVEAQKREEERVAAALIIEEKRKQEVEVRASQAREAVRVKRAKEQEQAAHHAAQEATKPKSVPGALPWSQVSTRLSARQKAEIQELGLSERILRSSSMRDPSTLPPIQRQKSSELIATLDPKEISFMQQSISYTSQDSSGDGVYTVLDNAIQLRDGVLKPQDLPTIRVWKDEQGRIWTLDHRRLAAYRIAGNLDSIPVQWVAPEIVERERFKFTTQSEGRTIRLNLGEGLAIVIE